MVIRIFCSILLVILVSSCGSFLCDSTSSIKGGLRSKSYYKSYIKKRINPAIVNLDTNVVYSRIDYRYIESDKKHIYVNDSLSLSTDIYYKFFANGTYYIFIKKGQNRILDSRSFDPYLGKIGFVISKKENYHFMSYSAINCGSFSKQDFENKGDTLIVKHGGNRGYRTWHYYVKHKVPKEWLNFEPDI